MFSRWVRTVPSEMPRRRAIWALVCPAASRCSSSQCRAVSLGDRVAAALGVEVGLVQVRAQHGEQVTLAAGEIRAGPADEDQPQGPPGPGGQPGAGGQAQRQLMLVPVGLAAVLVHAGAVPLPGRVEIRDLDDAAQVAGALGVAARAVPVVGPERRLVKFGVVGFDRNGLPEPVDLPAAVGAAEDHEIAADQS